MDNRMKANKLLIKDMEYLIQILQNNIKEFQRISDKLLKVSKLDKKIYWEPFKYVSDDFWYLLKIDSDFPGKKQLFYYVTVAGNVAATVTFATRGEAQACADYLNNTGEFDESIPMPSRWVGTGNQK